MNIRIAKCLILSQFYQELNHSFCCDLFVSLGLCKIKEATILIFNRFCPRVLSYDSDAVLMFSKLSKHSVCGTGSCIRKQFFKSSILISRPAIRWNKFPSTGSTATLKPSQPRWWKTEAARVPVVCGTTQWGAPVICDGCTCACLLPRLTQNWTCLE